MPWNQDYLTALHIDEDEYECKLSFYLGRVAAIYDD